METVARLAGPADRSPPSDEHIEQMQAIERSILSGELLKNLAREPAPEPEQAGLEDEAAQSQGAEEADGTRAVQISGSPGGQVTLRMRVPGDVLVHHRQLERLHREKLPDTNFVQLRSTADPPSRIQSDLARWPPAHHARPSPRTNPARLVR